MNNKHDEGRAAGVRVNRQRNETKPRLKEFSPLEAADIHKNHKSTLWWV